MRRSSSCNDHRCYSCCHRFVLLRHLLAMTVIITITTTTLAATTTTATTTTSSFQKTEARIVIRQQQQQEQIRKRNIGTKKEKGATTRKNDGGEEVILFPSQDDDNRVFFQNMLPNPLQLQLLTKSSISSSSSISSHEIKQQHHRRRTAVVHVGPEKTGTTSIQYALHKLEAALDADNYVRANKYFVAQPRMFLDCLVTNSNSNHGGGLKNDGVNYCDWNVYKTLQELGSKDNKNIVISAENLYNTQIDLDKLKYDFLAPWDDNIIIVMYYRRFYDWWISLHIQGNKKKPKISMRQSIVQHMELLRKYEYDINEKYVIGIKRRYEQYFDNIHIYNMHDNNNINNKGGSDGSSSSSTDVRESFFCDAIPHAINTCQEYYKLLDSETKKKAAETNNNNNNININNHDVKNTHHPLIYEEIAYYASSYGLNLWNESSITTTTGRYQMTATEYVTEQIQYRHEHVMNLTEYDFPLSAVTCPDADLYEYMYNKTIEYEKLLFPIYYEQYGHDEIMVNFHHSKPSFCYINATMVLLDNVPAWQEFFDALW